MRKSEAIVGFFITFGSSVDLFDDTKIVDFFKIEDSLVFSPSGGGMELSFGKGQEVEYLNIIAEGSFHL